MSNIVSSVDFSVLFRRVVGYWPDCVDVSDMIIYNNDMENYSVRGLFDIGEEIAIRLDDESDAPLLVNLSASIASCIRSAALFCTEISPVLLRPDTVRKGFERRLRRAEKDAELGWSGEHILLIKRYFEVNKD